MKFTFKCVKCGTPQEVNGPIGETPKSSECPICGGLLMRKFDPLVDIWRTSGVYKTDKVLSEKRNPEYD
jgi:predicted nucleic acid-binding Zn ribbon protein